MNILVCSLIVSCFAAPLAIAGDLGEQMRDHRIFCSQFVIEHPAPAIFADAARGCCRVGRRVHDCHQHDLHENDLNENDR